VVGSKAIVAFGLLALETLPASGQEPSVTNRAVFTSGAIRIPPRRGSIAASTPAAR
jgi:hypothetical protein